MAENDIYDSQRRYENFKQNLPHFALPPSERPQGLGKKGKYHCRNIENLQHFEALFACFEARDTSFVRRNRLINTLRLICHVAEDNLMNLDRNGINKIVAFMHTV